VLQRPELEHYSIGYLPVQAVAAESNWNSVSDMWSRRLAQYIAHIPNKLFGRKAP